MRRVQNSKGGPLYLFRELDKSRVILLWRGLDNNSQIGKSAIFRATIDEAGHPPVAANLAIDSGTFTSLRLYSPFVKKQVLLPPGYPVLASYGFGVGGEFPEKLGRVQTLQIGGLKITHPLTSFPEAEHGATASSDYDGTIGGALLRRFKVIFDYSRQRLILEPGPESASFMEVDTSGLVFESPDADHRTIAIRDVLSGTPAALAGLQPGDKVVTVNGNSAATVGVDGLRQALCQPGTYHFEIVRAQQKVEVDLTTTAALY